MSSLIAKNIQIGADTTATNNFTIYQPATPDGTLLIGNGNTGITSSLVALTSAGNLGIGTSAPSEKLAVAGNIKLGISGTSFIYGPSTTGRSVYSNSDTTAYITAYGSAYGSGLSSAFQFVTGTTKVTTLDSSGNLGLGVTPSAWSLGKSIEIAVAGAGMLGNGNQLTISKNAYFNAGWKYARTGDNALQYDLNGSTHAWFTAPSGTAGNAITFTQAMTLDASGNLGIGTSSPSSKLHVAATNAIVTAAGTTGWSGYSSTVAGTGSLFGTDDGVTFGYSTGSTVIRYAAGKVFGIQIGSTQVASFDSSGNLLVGVGSGACHTIAKGNTQNDFVLNVSGVSQGSAGFYSGTGTAFNAAAACVKLNSNNTTSRSINAAGTINASGADYAEYMTKAGEFNVAKGDVIGINADGKLTNLFVDAVSFCVKSTDPSYVGGDTWGIDFEDDAEGLEAARQTVDRIAFAGQVPVNVTGATAGQYIVPVNDNGAIKGEAVSSPTFEQYQQAVGKVIAIEADGRARIIVKVA